MIRKHQNTKDKNSGNQQTFSPKITPKHQATKVTMEELLEKVGVCQRLGYGYGCECLNECFIVRQHLDTKEY